MLTLRRFLSLLSAAVAAAGLAVALPAPADAIVGGEAATVNGGVVSIWTDNPNRNRCGGSLIQADKILLAAHCYYALTAEGAGRVDVRIGGITNTVPCTASTPAGADCYLSRTIVDYDAHPGYDPNAGDMDDLMVGVLDAAVPAAKAKPMRWRTGPLKTGETFRIQGYGWVCDGPPNLDCSTNYRGGLRQASFRAEPDSVCPTMDDPGGGQRCFRNGGFVAPCPGDSGTGGFTKGLDVNVLRVVVIGDGDDNTGRSCTTAPDGSPGAGYGIDIGLYQAWLTEVLFEDAAPLWRTPVPPVPVGAAATRGVYELVG